MALDQAETFEWLRNRVQKLESELKGRVDPSKPFRGANCLEKPERLAGQPIGQYHCPYCGMMLIAGLPHDEPDEDNPDYELLKELEPALQITEAEAEEALRAEGTSGKEVVNRFIERLLHERSKLQEELKEQHDALSKVWAALGITEYTGKHVAEHVAELKEELKAAQEERDRLFELRVEANNQMAVERQADINNFRAQLVEAVRGDGQLSSLPIYRFTVDRVVEIIQTFKPEKV